MFPFLLILTMSSLHHYCCSFALCIPHACMLLVFSSFTWVFSKLHTYHEYGNTNDEKWWIVVMFVNWKYCAIFTHNLFVSLNFKRWNTLIISLLSVIQLRRKRRVTLIQSKWVAMCTRQTLLVPAMVPSNLELLQLRVGLGNSPCSSLLSRNSCQRKVSRFLNRITRAQFHCPCRPCHIPIFMLKRFRSRKRLHRLWLLHSMGIWKVSNIVFTKL